MERKESEITKVNLHQTLPALKEMIFKRTRCNLISHCLNRLYLFVATILRIMNRVWLFALVTVVSSRLVKRVLLAILIYIHLCLI